jgi:outer membrane protein assembly factor BamD
MPRAALVAILSFGLLASCVHKKYETPIAKNTQQPDKVLFDQAVKDIEHGRYEVARISLQTLMNTYESSEYLAKAKLAVADSWFREGGANGLAQAEAEYKDFILFYPQMEESAQAQNRVCQIHYKQMDKTDRDWSQSLRAEDECRQLLVQYPNSKFAPATAQLVRNIQEALADHEFVVGNYYWRRDMNPAAANRLEALVNQWPLYSKAGEALYEAGDSYTKMGPRFRKQAGEMFARIVREYPLSVRAKDAQKRLEDMELPVPKADQAALDREKYELANYKRMGLASRPMALLRSSPDVSHAAKEGAPVMTDPKPTIPASVPVAVNADEGAGSGTGSGNLEVSATQPGANGALESKPDARTTDGTATTAGAAGTTSAATTPAPNQPLPTNRDKDLKKLREEQAKKQAKLDKKKKKKQDQQTPATTTNTTATPAVQTNPATQNPTAPNPATQQPPTGQPQPQQP